MKVKAKPTNHRVLDIMNSIPTKENVDAHWDSYNDSYYHDAHHDSYDDYGDNSCYHDEYRDAFVNENPVTKSNPRVLDIMNSIPTKENIDAHWDSYNDSYYHDTYHDSYDDYGDNSYYHDEYRDAFVSEHPVTKSNPRVLDIMNSIPTKENVDAHWDSYNDSYYHDAYHDSYDDYGDNSYYHDEYRDAFITEEKIKVKTKTYNG